MNMLRGAFNKLPPFGPSSEDDKISHTNYNSWAKILQNLKEDMKTANKKNTFAQKYPEFSNKFQDYNKIINGSSVHLNPQHRNYLKDTLQQIHKKHFGTCSSYHSVAFDSRSQEMKPSQSANQSDRVQEYRDRYLQDLRSIENDLADTIDIDSRSKKQLLNDVRDVEKKFFIRANQAVIEKPHEVQWASIISERLDQLVRDMENARRLNIFKEYRDRYLQDLRSIENDLADTIDIDSRSKKQLLNDVRDVEKNFFIRANQAVIEKPREVHWANIISKRLDQLVGIIEDARKSNYFRQHKEKYSKYFHLVISELVEHEAIDESSKSQLLKYVRDVEKNFFLPVNQKGVEYPGKIMWSKIYNFRLEQLVKHMKDAQKLRIFKEHMNKYFTDFQCIVDDLLDNDAIDARSKTQLWKKFEHIDKSFFQKSFENSREAQNIPTVHQYNHRDDKDTIEPNQGPDTKIDHYDRPESADFPTTCKNFRDAETNSEAFSEDEVQEPPEKSPDDHDNDLEIFDMQQFFQDDDSILANIDPKSLQYIDIIDQKCRQFDRQIDHFTGTKGGVQYFVIDEKLMQMIEKLDKIKNVESDIRERKEQVISYIQGVHKKLDAKASV